MQQLTRIAWVLLIATTQVPVLADTVTWRARRQQKGVMTRVIDVQVSQNHGVAFQGQDGS